MNLLIVGTISQDFINFVSNSKLLDKIFVTESSLNVDVPNIEYSSKEELLKKIKALQIDIVIIFNKNFVRIGMVDYLKSNFINVISVNQKWFNLEDSRLVAKRLLGYYKINIPKIILAPTEFPLVLKSDLQGLRKVITSLDELIQYTQKYVGQKTFLEEFLSGDCYKLLSLWDGVSGYHFEDNSTFTEVQKERLELLKVKLNIMFSEEKANFLGFYSTEIIWTKNDWYVLNIEMTLDEELILAYIKKDFLYILYLMVYQKINELK